MKPHIAIVDDNPRFLTGLLKAISKCADEVSISTIQTATEFEDRLPDFAGDPPQVFVLDVMLKWTKESRAASTLFSKGFRPLDGGFYVASAIRNTSSLRDVPIVFWSAGTPTVEMASQYLNKEDMSHLYFATKSSADDQMAKLLISIVSAQVDVKAPNEILPSLFDALELKPGAFGFRVDLKKLLQRGKSDA